MKKLILIFACFITCSMQIFAQETVTGMVTDDAGEALPGVTVTVKDTNIGTMSLFDGSYSIDVPDGFNTLVFSYIGMETKELLITGDVVNAVLKPSSEEIGEVVVTALGITKSEKVIGYASTSVSSDDITQTHNASAMNSLQGKIAGVTITGASGAPGASTQVVLRGYSSLAGNNQPLFIVDGVPINNSSNNFFTGTNNVERTVDMGNRANDINPDDIESMTILKGASATALYGSRAANGVIMITTKSGKKSDKINISLTSSATVSEILRVPEVQNIFGQGWDGHFAFEENGSWGPVLDGKDRVWGNVVDGAQKLKPFVALEDNWKDFYDRGFEFNNSISLSGGNEKTTFYTSYSNIAQDGIVPTDVDSYKRNAFSFRAATGANNFNASFSLNYIRKNSSFVYTGQGNADAGPTLYQDIIQIPRDISIVDMKDYEDPFNNLDNYFTPYADNPYFIINENGNEFNEDRLFGNVNLAYEFFENFKVQWRIGGDIANSQYDEWGAKAITTPGSWNDQLGRTDIPGAVTKRTRFARELTSDFIISYNNTFSNEISLSLLAGHNVNTQVFDNTYARVTNLTIPGFYDLSNSSQTPVVNPPVLINNVYTNPFVSKRLVGVFGQAEIGYSDFLYLTFTARNDWSSTLPEENRSFFYPGVNLSFVISDAIPALNSVMSFGKIRAAWGQTGNDADPYQIYSTMVQGAVGLGFGNLNLPLAGINGFEVSNQIGNKDLQPEITTEMELGIDFRFLKNRLGFDFAYYDRTTNNQIIPVDLDPSTGYSQQTKNIGEIKNKGIELVFSVSPIKTDDFSWDIRYIFSGNRNEVVELTEGLDEYVITTAYSIRYLAVVGEPLGVYEGPVYRYDPEGHVIVNAAGIPVASETQEVYGNQQSDYNMGLTNIFTYKGISLRASAEYRKGGLMYSYTGRLMEFVGNNFITTYNMRQPWIVENSVQEVLDPVTGEVTGYIENLTPIDYGNVGAMYNRQDNPTSFRNSVIDKTFFKLREVALSYTLPKSLFSNNFIESINVSAFGRNLLLWTPEGNKLIDPESSTFGNDLAGSFGEFANGPSIRSYGASIGITF